MNEIEKGFREGYAKGYNQGEEDTSRFDADAGKVRPATRKNRLEIAWLKSKAFASIAQPQLIPDPITRLKSDTSISSEFRETLAPGMHHPTLKEVIEGKGKV